MQHTGKPHGKWCARYPKKWVSADERQKFKMLDETNMKTWNDYKELSRLFKSDDRDNAEAFVTSRLNVDPAVNHCGQEAVALIRTTLMQRNTDLFEFLFETSMDHFKQFAVTTVTPKILSVTECCFSTAFYLNANHVVDWMLLQICMESASNPTTDPYADLNVSILQGAVNAFNTNGFYDKHIKKSLDSTLERLNEKIRDIDVYNMNHDVYQSDHNCEDHCHHSSRHRYDSDSD